MRPPAHNTGPADELPVRTPVEHVPITLFDLPCLVVRGEDAAIYISIRDLCTALGLQVSQQLRRIRTHTALRKGLARFRVQTEGGQQETYFLHLQLSTAWLLMINTSRTSETVRQRLDYLQTYLVAEVYAAFAELTGLPENAGAIEDLDDLRQINTAFSLLAERQERIEQSQDKARDVWRTMQTDIRELAERVQALEHKVTGTITKAQRGHIYQMVQRWADARVERDPRLSAGAARAGCWGLLKARFHIARYEDLPLSRYTECISFVKQSYAQLTGSNLDLPEQNQLDLE